MEFTNEQRLIVSLLTDIHKHLGIQDGLDVDVVETAMTPGKEWVLGWKYSELFRGEETPPQVTWVSKVLFMWEHLERSFAAYGDADKAELEGLVGVTARTVSFPGFDGNNEAEFGIANAIVTLLGRFPAFARRDLNAHMPMVEVYQRMLPAFEQLGAPHLLPLLSVDQMANVLRERVHPDNR